MESQQPEQRNEKSRLLEILIFCAIGAAVLCGCIKGVEKGVGYVYNFSNDCDKWLQEVCYRR